MAAPVGSHVCKWFEAVGNAVVELRFVRIGLGIRLGDALGDHLLVALFVASVSAVCALHAGSVLEKLAAKRASHNVVKLLLDKLVAILLHNFLLALTNGTLAVETNVKRPTVLDLLGCDTSVQTLANAKRPYQSSWSVGSVQRVPAQTMRQ